MPPGPAADPAGAAPSPLWGGGGRHVFSVERHASSAASSAIAHEWYASKQAFAFAWNSSKLHCAALRSYVAVAMESVDGVEIEHATVPARPPIVSRR